MDVLWWCVVGLLAGWLAKLVGPGREPGGFLATMAIGLVGSFIGGIIWRVMFNSTQTMGSVLVAFIGSVVLLMLYHAFTNTRTRV
jgi:uncharacterized membrane protein YeaQ/YmgE (transglycosylase-associated protein family)